MGYQSLFHLFLNFTSTFRVDIFCFSCRFFHFISLQCESDSNHKYYFPAFPWSSRNTTTMQYRRAKTMDNGSKNYIHHFGEKLYNWKNSIAKNCKNSTKRKNSKTQTQTIARIKWGVGNIGIYHVGILKARARKINQPWRHLWCQRTKRWQTFLARWRLVTTGYGGAGISRYRIQNIPTP